MELQSLISHYQTGSISPADSTNLGIIASGVASVFGDARYDALAFLGMESTPGVAANGNRALVKKHNAFEQFIAIHPNPSNWYFKISGVNLPNANIQIFDMRHNLVQSINNHEISRPVAIDKLSAGLYTVRLTSFDGSFNYLKLVVCR